MHSWLSYLRWWLFGADASEYHCLTSRLPLPDAIDKNNSSMSSVGVDEHGPADYDVPAFLRKASQSPDEPWPNSQ